MFSSLSAVTDATTITSNAVRAVPIGAHVMVLNPGSLANCVVSPSAVKASLATTARADRSLFSRFCVVVIVLQLALLAAHPPPSGFFVSVLRVP